MSHPQVTIEEIIEGPRPVRSVGLNRVGGVGTSRKGKYGALILLATDNDLDRKIARSVETGSVGMQAARDEGASDQAFVRVMGRARAASRTITVTGTGSIAESYTLTITTGIGATAVARPYATTLNAGEDALSVTAELISLVNADADSPVIAQRDPLDPANSKVMLIAKVPGAAGNDIQFAFAEGDATTNDMTETIATGTLLGGFDGPAAATLALGNLRLDALSEGPDGNLIRAVLIPGLKPRTVELRLTDNATSPAYVESFVLEYANGALINTNEFNALRGSTLVRGFYTGVAADFTTVALPSGSGNLVGGNDPAPIDETDYFAALRILARNQANIIFAPGQVNGVRQQLVAQAENATILDGLRIAVINAPQRTDALNAEAATTGFDSKNAVMVAGWATYSGQPQLADLSVSPDGFYAGHLAATRAHVSPAARSSSPFFRSIVAVDSASDEQSLHAYTDARLEAIVQDPATNGYHCLNGRTTASDAAHYYVCIRRMANQIKTDLFFASQALKSEPKDDNLVSSIQGMVQGYLEGLANIGRIKGGEVAGIRKTANGIRVDFMWYPVYPADQIDYGMRRSAVDV